MRHRIHHKKLNRTSEHRAALHRQLAQSLFEHGQVKTTLPKAKDVQPFCEKLITLAVKVRKRSAAADQAGALSARRRIYRMLGDRCLIPAEHQADYNAMSDAARAKTLRMASGRRYRTGEPKGRLAFTAESVMHRLIEKIAPKFEDRPGGYTRVIRLAKPRLGDNAARAVLQLVGDEASPGPLTKPAASARRRRAGARYAFAIQEAKSWGAKGRSSRGDGQSKAAEAGAKDAVADSASPDDATATKTASDVDKPKNT